MLLFLCEFLDDSSTHLYMQKNKEKECGKFKNLISLHLINIACVEREDFGNYLEEEDIVEGRR